ncbi:Subtilisin-like serine protease [Lunatimonas lonarensis]|uniref:Subtilisin-like serine protease n=1 Tax=Lunatimonas lonarensis TaxID=1232681 RepID=R7ZRU6_9BACT|nr:S8 family serine peptidase [Lunatimonas lonarensis]EON76714.1 Subtilisin-like serine protease [Lunatimonas lonarensis]
MVSSSRSVFLLLFTVFLTYGGYSQDRYAIHYHYKPTERYSLDRPGELLTEASLLRRDRERIRLDSTDLPVADSYIAAVEAEVSQVLYHTHWLNASVVVADEKAMATIRSWPFVAETVLIGRGPGIRSSKNGRKEVRVDSAMDSPAHPYQPYDFQNELLGIPQMHLDGYTGAGVRVAVFDAGFHNVDNIPAFKHLFEQGKIIGTRDFVDVGSTGVFKSDTHGTGALSLIAANDNRLVAGAYDASIILCITEDMSTEFRIEEYNWIKAAEYADSLGVDIINSSLGYNHFDDVDMNYGKDDMDGKTAIISIGASIAASKGILVVTSNGNEGNLSWRTVTAPADSKDVLAVGAISTSLEKAGFSSVGPTADGRIKPDLVAYGTGVNLWRYTSGPSFSSGTSFSAPQVAALAAGLWQANPNLKMAELKELLIRSGHQAENPNMEIGYGIPNYERAMLGRDEDSQPVRELIVSLFPNPLEGDRLFVMNFPPQANGVRLISSAGNLVSQWTLGNSELRNPMEFHVGDILPGLYIVEFQSTNWAQRHKLLKR